MKFCQLLRTYICTYYSCNFLHITLFLCHVSWTSKPYSFHRPSGKAPAILSENYVYRNFYKRKVIIIFFLLYIHHSRRNYFVSFNIKLKRTDTYMFEHRSSSSIIFEHVHLKLLQVYIVRFTVHRTIVLQEILIFTFVQSTSNSLTYIVDN